MLKTYPSPTMVCYYTAHKLARCCQSTLIKNFYGLHATNSIKNILGAEFPNLQSVIDLNIANFEGLLVTFNEYKVVVFRQSNDCYDWKTNLSLFPDQGMHSGFFHACELIYPVIDQLVADTPFYLTGHSLGGALTIGLSLLMQERSGWMGSYAFGAPKIVTKAKADSIPQAVKDKLFVFRHSKDIFPFLPPGYFHIGKSLFINDEQEIIEDYIPPLTDILSIRWDDLYLHHHVTNYVQAIKKAKG